MTIEPNSRMILYARVSKDKVKQQHSIAEQLDRMRAACVAFEYEPVIEIEDEDAFSGDMNRPGLQKALQMLRDGQADGIMVTRLDRLTRSAEDWLWLCREVFTKHTLSSLSDHLDTSTAAGRLVISIMVSVSQFEREKIGENTSAVLQHRRREKKVYCGKLFGYNQAIVNGERVLVPNPAEQACLKRMLELETQGYGTSIIAQALYAEGYKTAKGGDWSHGTVKKILEREKKWRDEKLAADNTPKGDQQ